VDFKRRFRNSLTELMNELAGRHFEVRNTAVWTAKDICYYIIGAIGFTGGHCRWPQVSKFILFWNHNRKLEISTAPTKQSLEDQLIHRRLAKTKLVGRKPRSRVSGRQTVRPLWWMVFGVEMGKEEGEEDQEVVC